METKLKKICGFKSLSTLFFIMAGFFFISFLSIGIIIDLSALYGLIFPAVLSLIGILFLFLNRIYFDDDIIIVKPIIKQYTIYKNDIRELYCYYERGRYNNGFYIVVNLDGRIDRTCKTVNKYIAACRELGMERIYLLKVNTEKDFYKLFASHPHLPVFGDTYRLDKMEG